MTKIYKLGSTIWKKYSKTQFDSEQVVEASLSEKELLAMGAVEDTSEEIAQCDLNIKDYLDGRASKKENRVQATTDNVDNLWWRTNKLRDTLNEVVKQVNQHTHALHALQEGKNL